MESPFFEGKEKCSLAQEPIEKIKEILGIQEKIEI
nr:MAG TPA: hypothetical protein [Caudoviricetes sp.]